jgi:hypothetical protein
MTDTLPRVLVPYADFLERRERRRQAAAARPRQDDEDTIDVTAVAVAPVKPLLREDKNRYESPCRVKNPDRTT